MIKSKEEETSSYKTKIDIRKLSEEKNSNLTSLAKLFDKNLNSFNKHLCSLTTGEYYQIKRKRDAVLESFFSTEFQLINIETMEQESLLFELNSCRTLVIDARIKQLVINSLLLGVKNDKLKEKGLEFELIYISSFLLSYSFKQQVSSIFEIDNKYASTSSKDRTTFKQLFFYDNLLSTNKLVECLVSTIQVKPHVCYFLVLDLNLDEKMLRNDEKAKLNWAFISLREKCDVTIVDVKEWRKTAFPHSYNYQRDEGIMNCLIDYIKDEDTENNKDATASKRSLEIAQNFLNYESSILLPEEAKDVIFIRPDLSFHTKRYLTKY